MADILGFLKRNLTKVVVIGVAGAAVIVAGTIMIVDRAQYAAYEQRYDAQAEEQRAAFPALPKGTALDNGFVTYDAQGAEVVSSKSSYKNSFIYYARDASIAPLSETKAQEYKKSDDTLLGECISGLNRAGGAITFTVRTPSHGYADIDIAMRNTLTDENGVGQPIANITDEIKIQTNGLDVKTESFGLAVSEDWTHLILKDAWLIKGENTLTFTTSAYNPYHVHMQPGGNGATQQDDLPLYIMPDIRNVTVMTNVDVYTPVYEFDVSGFKTDYRLVEIPDLSTIKCIKKVGDPEISYAEEEVKASDLSTSIDYAAGKVVIRLGAKASKEIPITIDKSPEKNTLQGEVDGKQVTVVVKDFDKAEITSEGKTCEAKIALTGKKGLATVKLIEKLSGDDEAYGILPESFGIEAVGNGLQIVLAKYYMSTQKANSNTNGGTSQTGNTYFCITAAGAGSYLTAFWNWTYSGDKAACLKCSYSFDESAMRIVLSDALQTNGVEQWQYVGNKTFTVSSITAGDVPDHLTGMPEFVIY